MGWERWGDEAADGQFHEGYLIGVERVTYVDRLGCVVSTNEWREVGADFDHNDDPGQRERRPVHHVQVVCGCGWRSERMHAPLGTYWSPCTTELPVTFDFEKAADEVTYLMWRAHVDGLGSFSLSERGRARLAAQSVVAR
jgi:hypothetical protein